MNRINVHMMPTIAAKTALRIESAHSGKIEAQVAATGARGSTFFYLTSHDRQTLQSGRAGER